MVIVLLLSTHASIVVGHLDNQLKGRRAAKLGYPGSIRGYSTSATQDFCFRTSENAVKAKFIHVGHSPRPIYLRIVVVLVLRG